jgi:hypothetical protein
MNEREATLREPDQDTGNYEAQASSAAPVQERRAEMREESAETPGTAGREGSGGLMQDQRLEYFAGRWDSIQGGFVDDPRRTVEQADRLVAEVIDHLAKVFRDERAKLEGQWSRSGKADTEDLRIAMQRYRDFFRTLVGR